MIKILVTGFGGQLGYDVVKAAMQRGIDAVGVDRDQLDLTDEKAIRVYFEDKSFDAIVHCAAYTAVDAAEDDVETATAVNVHATQYLVDAARKMSAKFINVSTDYVYSGEGEIPFEVTDVPAPTNVYGVTKLAGEEIALTYERTFIARISWVFGINGNNFVKTMLRLGDAHERLTVVADQIGSPTYTVDVAKVLLDMLETSNYGTYNVSNEGFCSWADFAKEIFVQSDKNVEVVPVTSAEYPTKATRPLNSRMSKEALLANGFALLPSWQDALSRYLKEIRENEK